MGASLSVERTVVPKSAGREPTTPTTSPRFSEREKFYLDSEPGSGRLANSGAAESVARRSFKGGRDACIEEVGNLVRVGGGSRPRRLMWR